jgi:pyruvate formate lyase activating enzyme
MGCEHLNILGFQKTTLLDFPGHVASTVFFGGCNFRCPFCHNGELVLSPRQSQPLDPRELLDFFRKRKGILDGVCVTGGEPTLEPELPEFLKAIKDLGLSVKLDTNGYRPRILESILEQQLADYVAMDIKGAPGDYAAICGLPELDISRIQKSVQLLMDSRTPYEFRTTVVKELHNRDSFTAIGKWIAGADAYFLQGYQDSEYVISPGFHAYTLEELKHFQTLLSTWLPRVEIRGVEH